MARGVTRGAASRNARGERASNTVAASKDAAAKKGAAPKSNERAAPKAAEPKAAKPVERSTGVRRDEGYIAVAEVARPHGVQGELRLKVYNPDSDLLEQKPRVRLRLPDGTTRDASIVSAREANKALLVRFAGIDDRDAAETLRNAEICVPRASFPALEDGEFYACDVEGARAVMRSSGEEIGHVVGLASYPTCDVLLIERPGAARIEVPLLDPYVGAVDVERGVVEILTIEGLD
ncbi:16S rRNA processing protein RimM [Minicystis rosea]|nr:16S rRNA processing protein RimM [Minicystis rosea]